MTSRQGQVRKQETHGSRQLPFSARELWGAFSQQLKPRFHEISTYSIAFTCLWIFSFYPDFRDGALMFFSGWGSHSLDFFLLGLVTAIGLLLCLAEVFIRRQKSRLERLWMGWFALAVSVVTSFFIGVDLLPSRSQLSVGIAVWNILMSVMLMAQLGSQTYDVTDEEASFWQVLLTTAFLVAMLLVAERLLHLPWTLTMSLGIFYSTTIMYLATWAADYFSWRLPGFMRR